MTKKEIFDYVSSHAAGTVLSFPERGPWGSSKYRGNFSGWISFDMGANRYRKSLQAEGQPPISAEICRFHIAELI